MKLWTAFALVALLAGCDLAGTNDFANPADVHAAVNVGKETTGYKVTFDKNDDTATATGTMDAQVFDAGKAQKLAPLRFERGTGWTFLSWNTQKDGKGDTYTDGSSFSLPALADLTLYAQWTPHQTNKITFDGNGADGGATGDQKIIVGGTTKLTVNGFTRIGYHFLGWSGTPSGTVKYNDQDSYTMADTNDTLYAVWAISQFKVTFYGNTATAELTADYQSTVTLTNGFTKTGYDFAMWNTKADGSGRRYQGGATYYLPAADTTLYAMWTIASFTLSFNAGTGGTGTVPASQTLVYQSQINLPSPSLLAGPSVSYFAGWSTTSTGAVTYGDTALFTMGSDNVTLYAVWSSVAMGTITFAKNDGSGSTTAQTSLAGNATLNANGFSRPQYIFTGWSTTSNGTVAYVDGATSVPLTTSGLTLFAQWTAWNHVTFNANGGSSTLADLPLSPTATTNLTAIGTAVTRTGYTFTGWSNTSGGTVAYTDGAAYPRTDAAGATVTLYAQWNINTYKVTFNANGGSGTMADQSLVFNTTPALTANAFSRAAFTFAGWSKTSGGAVDFTDGANYLMGAGSTTLYAVWTGLFYNVTFNLNSVLTGAASSMASQSIQAGVSTNLSPSTLTPPYGYDFASWNTASNGLGTTYYDQANFPAGIVANLPLYAQYTPRTYTISYYPNGGSGYLASQPSVSYGTSVTLLNLTYTGPTDYVFKGWNTLANGTGDAYGDKATFVYPYGTDIALQAQWAPVFKSFTLPGSTKTTIDTTNRIVAVQVPTGTTLSSLAATFTTTASTTVKVGVTTQSTGATANNFTSSVTYTLTGTAGTSTWTVFVLANTGTVSLLAGNGTAAMGGNGGFATAAQFDQPSGVTYYNNGSTGFVYVADEFSNQIRQINLSTNVVSLYAGLVGGGSGQQNNSGALASFNNPYDVVSDSSGVLYVADYSNQVIRRIATSGAVTTLATGQGNPIGVSVDPTASNLYVADYVNHVIRKVSLPGGSSTVLAGTSGASGFVNGSSGATSSFYSPKGIAVDPTNTYVYVADGGNNVIRRITIASGLTITYAGSGTPDEVDGQGTAASFKDPMGLACDSRGNLFVADYAGHTIRWIAPGGWVSTLAGTPGVYGYVDAQGTSAKFYFPIGIAVDPTGALYVADLFNHRIRKIQ